MSQTFARRAGDSLTTADIYDRYVNRLIRLAQTRLKRRYQSKLDPDDVVHSVFRTFYRRCDEGQLSIEDSGSLWALSGQAEEMPVYRSYLDGWGDWVNPWNQ